MSRTAVETKNSAASSTDGQAGVYCERAMAVMRSLEVPPVPRNYSIFFASAAGQPTGLVSEMERAIRGEVPITEAFLEHIYATYISDEQQAKIVQDTTNNTKAILTEMMQNLTVFKGTTTEISHEVAEQLRHLEEQLQHLNSGASEEMVRILANTLVESAKVMQASSEDLNTRLATAQEEITKLRTILTKVMTEADRDFLTGCFNRKAFDKRLISSIQEANEENTPLTLLMLDIDHFKKFNDNYGHLIGDEVLKIVARTLMESLKGMDCVSRYGGEEFAVILPRTPVGAGMLVAESIRKTISGREFKRKTTGQNYGTITVSVGVAAFRHGADMSANFMQRADEALYRAKKAGRNKVIQENLAS